MPQGDVEVINDDVNARALVKAGNVNVERAGHEAAQSLIPYIQSDTRSATGVMRAGWNAEENAFVNSVDYASYQEFGTQYVEKTDAIRRAVDSHEDKLKQAFDTEVDNARKKAGLDSK